MVEIKNFYSVYPLGWHAEDIFARLDLTGKFLFVIRCKEELVEAAKKGLTINDFPFNILDKKIQYAKQNNLKFIIIFEEVYEAPCYYDIKDLVDSISRASKIPISETIIMSGAQHQKGADIKNCHVLSIIGFDQIFENENIYFDPTHHFISLARYSRMHRVLVTREIWQRGLDKFGYCSLGCTEHDVLDYEKIKTTLGPFANRYPTVLDVVVKDLNDQNKSQDTRISHAFLNVVLETSYDYEINQKFWSVPFWTEKTSKPFAWGQIPLILGPQNNLNILREFKFDLFEDIIDISYDKEPDPYKRIQLYVDQLEKICKWPLDKCIEYKKQNIVRFKYNNDLIRYIFWNKSFEHSIKNASEAIGAPVKKI